MLELQLVEGRSKIAAVTLRSSRCDGFQNYCTPMRKPRLSAKIPVDYMELYQPYLYMIT